MTAHDFVKNYIMHDSLINGVKVLNNGTTIVLFIDFAFWMQAGYNGDDPETGMLKVIFQNVAGFSIPENVDWNELSILDSTVSGETVKFSLMNDLTDVCSELWIQSDRITVCVL